LWIVVVDKRGLDAREKNSRRWKRIRDGKMNPEEAEVSEHTVQELGSFYSTPSFITSFTAK
jgi:hypothetical protein